MKNYHPTQLGILNKLLFAPSLRYTDLKYDPDIENNTFQFHLDTLIETKLIKKDGNTYELTSEGKKVATHLDTDTNTMIGPRKVSVCLHAVRKVNDEYEVVIYKRLKHPFYGKQGHPTGKVQIGENILDAAKRELFEECALEGTPILFNVTHYLVKDADTKTLLDDKIFFDVYFLNPTGELKSNNEGEYTWIKEKDIEKIIINPFDTVEVYRDSMNKILKFDNQITFQELQHLTKDF